MEIYQFNVNITHSRSQEHTQDLGPTYGTNNTLCTPYSLRTSSTDTYFEIHQFNAKNTHSSSQEHVQTLDQPTVQIHCVHHTHLGHPPAIRVHIFDISNHFTPVTCVIRGGTSTDTPYYWSGFVGLVPWF